MDQEIATNHRHPTPPNNNTATELTQHPSDDDIHEEPARGLLLLSSSSSNSNDADPAQQQQEQQQNINPLNSNNNNNNEESSSVTSPASSAADINVNNNHIIPPPDTDTPDNNDDELITTTTTNNPQILLLQHRNSNNNENENNIQSTGLYLGYVDAHIQDDTGSTIDGQHATNEDDATINLIEATLVTTTEFATPTPTPIEILISPAAAAAQEEEEEEKDHYQLVSVSCIIISLALVIMFLVVLFSVHVWQDDSVSSSSGDSGVVSAPSVAPSIHLVSSSASPSHVMFDLSSINYANYMNLDLNLDEQEDDDTTVRIVEGAMFDLVIGPNYDIRVTGMDVHCVSSSSGSNNMMEIQLYMRQGTHVGYEYDANAWLLLGETSNDDEEAYSDFEGHTIMSTACQGPGVPTPLPELQFPKNIVLSSDRTYSFYVTTRAAKSKGDVTHFLLCDVGSARGNIVVQDDHVTLLEGAGIHHLNLNHHDTNNNGQQQVDDNGTNELFELGSASAPRVFHGSIRYHILYGDNDEDDAVMKNPGDDSVDTPHPIIDPAAWRQLDTTYNGEHVLDGCMFDVVNISNLNIQIRDFHLHIYVPSEFAASASASAIVVIEAYTRNDTGSYIGHHKSPSSWKSIIQNVNMVSGSSEVLVEAAPRGTPTVFPADSFLPVDIAIGDTQAFYLTRSRGNGELIYTKRSNAGVVYVEGPYLQVLVGLAIAYPFGGDLLFGVWNGSIRYSVEQ